MHDSDEDGDDDDEDEYDDDDGERKSRVLAHVRSLIHAVTYLQSAIPPHN